MAVAVIMPRQGQSVESCIITKWYKQVGDKVNVGDVLFSYETDKAAFEEPANEEGTLLAIFAEEDEDVPCLQNIAVIGSDGEDISAFSGDTQTQPTEKEAVEEEVAVQLQAQEKHESTQAEDGDNRMKISPRAKHSAENQNVDLTQAVPTGPNGRIIERDVLELAKSGKKVTSAAAAKYQGGAIGTGLGGGVTTNDLNQAGTIEKAAITAPAIAPEFEDVKVSNMRKVIAKAMHGSLSEMAQLTATSSFDASSILAFRKKIKENAEKLNLANITINDIVLFAVSRVLRRHKALNAHFLNDTMRYFNTVNLGMAVDTERGLMVPTIYNANNKSLNDIAKETKDLSKMAQAGNISPDLLSNGTFTVTNLGSLGVESFTPVINPPQTAILGVCTITERITKKDGKIDTYPAMTLSLTFDHRAVDGAPAARFLKDLCDALENFDLTLIQ